ncbi:hypothetical protein FH729_09935 [Bacteroides thetaiotaomicron]|nr:hypothetical protein F9Z91_13880 [Bacteroides thetaiotaomicron]MBL3918623.1 hypothetical protein [Bacteroides thetaiotaomicron]MBL3934492.1 hypothetical protein [Bacteroides thetaiotaomicron]MBL3943465.1 hypothetical protein [Bacteroides thetaiotaomicron]MBL3947468.1 hypothetical protein [Bacteroides thetaiotaomicron]
MCLHTNIRNLQSLCRTNSLYNVLIIIIMRNINLIVIYVIVSIYKRDNQLFISIITTLFFNE